MSRHLAKLPVVTPAQFVYFYFSRLCLIVACLRWLASPAVAAPAKPTDSQFAIDLAAICATPAGQSPSRVIGSDGYGRTQDYLKEQIARIAADNPNVVIAPDHQFPVMMPVTKRATLTLAG